LPKKAMTGVDAAVQLHLTDEIATARLAEVLAAAARGGDVLALSGTLGSGKTVFARAFIRARAGLAGAPSPDEIVSPTFTLVQVYDWGEAAVAPAVWHFDLYRLRSPEEAWELAIEDAFTDGISLIEWPDRIGGLLPADRLEIALSSGEGPTSRRACVRGRGGWHARLDALTEALNGLAS